MGGLSFARYFRLRPGAIEYDADGLRVGGVALLTRDEKGAWTRRHEGELNRELSKLYRLPLDCERKGRALDKVAAALTNGELARAQIGALLLRFPDPPAPASVHADGLEKRRLVDGLLACGLLKADADWDEKHPRTGAPPIPAGSHPRRARRRQTRRSQMQTLRRRALRAAARRRSSSPLRRRPASIRYSLKTCRRPPCAGWRRWRRASPPRRSCSTRSSCRATTGSSRRAASPVVPTSPIAGRTTKPRLRSLSRSSSMASGEPWPSAAPRRTASSSAATAAPSPGSSAVPIGDRPWSRRSTPLTVRSRI